MTRLSARYALQIAILTGVALVPVLIHSYAGVRVDDCAHPEALVPRGFAERTAEPRRNLMRTAFDAQEWREGTILVGPGLAPLSYSIIRSWNPKRLYYRPEYRMLTGDKPNKQHVDFVEVDGERVPVHRAEYPSHLLGANRNLAMYVLLYESEPVENPYWAQLEAAPAMLVRGSRPMTLLMAWGTVPTSQYSAAQRRAQDWLVQTLREYRSVCTP